MADRLEPYRKKRKRESPEPTGNAAGSDGGEPRFVIQEHSATRLHWDLRLERDGVLASWALPRGLPLDPRRNNMAVHTEDHPLEYLDFHGEIPKGNYGAGTMGIWDTGTYETHEWEQGKLVVTLHGNRVDNKFALFRAGKEEKNWLIHRMDPPPDGWEPLPSDLRPMQASVGKRIPRNEDEWAYEIEWVGLRVLAYSEPGRLWLEHAERGDVTAQFPEVRRLNRQLSSADALFDGVVTAFGSDGLPVAGAIERRLAKKSPRPLKSDPRFSLQLFDLLHFDGRSLLGLPYTERRHLLEELELSGDGWQTPGNHRGEGAALRDHAAALGLPGIVAKRLDSTYRPGVESKDWRRLRH
jgi:bifunctional non-homologous end joining protein LigD